VIQEPVQPVIKGPSGPPSRPPRRRGGIQIGLVIAAGLALAIPVIAITAAPRGQAPTLAAGASASAGASDDHDRGPKRDKTLKFNNGRGNGLGGGNGNGNGGLKGNGGQRGAITIRAISGSQLSLETEDGWSRTITVTPTTVITKGGQPAKVEDLKVGDQIRFSQTRSADGSYVITAIAVPTPVAGGEVTAIGPSSISVTGRGGAPVVITVTDATVYQLGKASGSKADVKVGVKVFAQGTVSGDTFTAITVRVALPDVAGEVSAKTKDSITIKHGDGSTTVVHVTDKTTFEVRDKEAASLADVTVGDRVEAEGTVRADGSMDAVAVEAGPRMAPMAPKPNAPETSAAPG
jgi:hypothetical protein